MMGSTATQPSFQTFRPRPRYETTDGLAREKSFSEDIGRHTGTTLRKLPDTTKGIYVLDYVSEKDGVAVGAVEIKQRNNEFRRYSTIHISEHKIKAAQKWIDKGIPAFLFYQFTDGRYYHRIRPMADYTNIQMGGRRDRNDPLDIERMVHIPLSAWVKWNG